MIFKVHFAAIAQVVPRNTSGEGATRLSPAPRAVFRDPRISRPRPWLWLAGVCWRSLAELVVGVRDPVGLDSSPEAFTRIVGGPRVPQASPLERIARLVRSGALVAYQDVLAEWQYDTGLAAPVKVDVRPPRKNENDHTSSQQARSMRRQRDLIIAGGACEIRPARHRGKG